MGDSQRSLPPPAFNAGDLKVHRTRKNDLWKIDENRSCARALLAAFDDEPPHYGSFSPSLENRPCARALLAAFDDEPPHYGSFSPPLGTPRCDEASSSGDDLPKSRSDGRSKVMSFKREDKVEDVNLDDLCWKRSEGQDVDVNLNISGAPRCDEAPSPTSSCGGGPTEFRSDEAPSPTSSCGGGPTEFRSDRSKDFTYKCFTIHYGRIYRRGAPRCNEAPSPTSSCGRGPTEFRSDRSKGLTFHLGGLTFHLGGHAYLGSDGRLYWKEIDNGQVEEDLLLTGQEEEDLLVPEPQKAYIHNNEQVEEDLLVPEPQKVYINTGQVEEDLLVPEPQKAYIHNNEQVEEDLLSTGRQKVFKMEALEVATNNFHKDNKVGQGGFGAVYKGTTHDGKQIAVKKMSFTSDERSPEFLKKQFENEKLLAEVQHRNLVNLLGSCEQESQGFLVYEYLPNKSLDKFLFDPENRKLLDWHKRYNIIQGIARGLQYLHEDSRVRIVHRDIKASNILLDEKLNPKIADFGTANLFPEDRTHVTATSAVGTFGYMAPECLMTGKLSVRTDVYSFGIVLLELLTGEKISSDALKLLGWVWRSYKRKEVLQTIDPTIIETWDKEKGKALSCIQVALLCVQENSSDRPTMSEVTAMLQNYKNLPLPKKPPFQPSTRRSWF